MLCKSYHSRSFIFSCVIMPGCFSSILQKPVFTFKSDRFTEPTLDLYKKLLQAQSANGVVITNPTSLKSFFLKFIEAINSYQELVNEEKQLDDYSKSSNLRRVFYKLRYFLGNRARAQLSEPFSIGLEKSSQGLREILKSELLSELNWPLGRKNAFDFTDKCTLTSTNNSEESNARNLPEELVVTCRYAV